MVTNADGAAADYPAKVAAFEEILRGLSGSRIGVAVSGGTDSRLLAHTLLRLGIPFMAVHATGLHMSPAETLAARRWLAGKGLRHLVVRFDPLSLPAVQTNAQDRCYHCKYALFSAIRDLLGADTTVLDGSNASDAGEYRPGRKALQELGIRSPLAQAGLSKADIRRLAEETGMDNPQQPSRPCLLTRFAYGTAPDADSLVRLGRAEDALAEFGLTDFRLRIPEPGIALLQIADHQKSLAQKGLDTVKSLLAREGFSHAQIDYVETISGYYDRGNNPAGALDKHSLHE